MLKPCLVQFVHSIRNTENFSVDVCRRSTTGVTAMSVKVVYVGLRKRVLFLKQYPEAGAWLQVRRVYITIFV